MSLLVGPCCVQRIYIRWTTLQMMYVSTPFIARRVSKVWMVCLSLGESKSHWLPKVVSYTVQFHIEERRRRVALQEIEDLFPKEVCCHVVFFSLFLIFLIDCDCKCLSTFYNGTIRYKYVHTLDCLCKANLLRLESVLSLGT